MNNLTSTPSMLNINFRQLNSLQSFSSPADGPILTPSCLSTSTVGNPQDTVTTSTMGERLAQSTMDAAAGNRNLSRYRCYNFVKQGLAQEGVSLEGKSAYMAANQLARDERFSEVKVSRNQLSELPAGAVVVWNRTKDKSHPHGHISVALGDGREVSDRIRNQTETYPSGFRVFLPQGTALKTS